MNLLDETSLAATVDAAGNAIFFGHPIPQPESRRLAAWLASRQGLPRSYAGMFAPTASDFKHGIHLFTGERITSGAATGHILGEETCRLLFLLDSDLEEAQSALRLATASMDQRLSESESESGRLGFY